MTKPKPKAESKPKRKAPARSAPQPRPKKPDAVWSLQDAKNSLSAVIEAAQEEPQTVTKHGRRTAVVVAAEEYDRLTAAQAWPNKTFVEHLLDMPQGGEDFERLPFALRDVEF
ncbi:MAG: type II toxin-antitoxin system Phd/YefM family antitoxin [Parvularculaceae bacterium]